MQQILEKRSVSDQIIILWGDLSGFHGEGLSLKSAEPASVGHADNWTNNDGRYVHLDPAHGPIIAISRLTTYSRRKRLCARDQTIRDSRWQDRGVCVQSVWKTAVGSRGSSPADFGARPTCYRYLFGYRKY
jgi:hypothetical protein